MYHYYPDVGGSDDFQDGGHGGHFGFPKIKKCVVRGVSRIEETKV